MARSYKDILTEDLRDDANLIKGKLKPEIVAQVKAVYDQFIEEKSFKYSGKLDSHPYKQYVLAAIQKNYLNNGSNGVIFQGENFVLKTSRARYRAENLLMEGYFAYEIQEKLKEENHKLIKTYTYFWLDAANERIIKQEDAPFLFENKDLKEMNPKHLLTLKYLLMQDYRFYIVLEKFDAKRFVPKSHSQIIEIAKLILQTLSCLNKVNCIHCDLSTNNILINPEGTDIRIIDFGSLQIMRNTVYVQRKEPNFVISEDLTSNDVAPPEAEVFKQETDIFPSIEARDNYDIWSLGMILYKWLSGKSLYSNYLIEKRRRKEIEFNKKRQRGAEFSFNDDKEFLFSEYVEYAYDHIIDDIKNKKTYQFDVNQMLTDTDMIHSNAILTLIKYMIVKDARYRFSATQLLIIFASYYI